MEPIRFGGGVDAEIWASILSAGGPAIEHDLWCAAIRAVAAAVLMDRGWKPPPPDDEDDSEPDILASKWLDDSMPHGAALTWIIGELDYFRDIDLVWYELVSLSGDACGYTTDVVGDLKGILFHSPDARDAVTEQLVEDFYDEWRTRFLRRVLREAEVLKAKNDEVAPEPR